MYAQMALQLLEKDIHEKQDSLVALRKQLEELKAANIKMQSQLKVGCISPCLSFPHCLYFPTLSLPPPPPPPTVTHCLPYSVQVANDTHQRDSLKVRSLESKLAQLTAQSKQTEKE